MDSSRLGKSLAGKYRLDAELGRGGMGVVYRAFHLRVHKEFAVKLLLAEVAEHKSVAQRFFLEAQAAGRIGHPGILDVYDVGEDDKGTPFIVMELLRGEALAALLRRTRLEPRAACWVAAQVLEVLDAAHRAGVVHRDVKPQNVFLCEASGGTRTVKLLDFGIAKFAASPETSALTRSGEIIGSPLYMAPEQAKGELDVDARVDVWSVGAMLFEMLTGTAAHAASTPVAVLAKILTEPAPPPSGASDSIPNELDAVVQRALAIDRGQRIASAREMLDALEEVRKKLGWSEAPPTFPEAVRGPALVDGQKSSSGAITSTIEAPSGPRARDPGESRASAEPLLEAAVTNDRAQPPRRKPWRIGVAVLALAAAAVVPWLVPGWSGKEAATKTGATPAPPPPSAPAPPPQVSAVATSEPAGAPAMPSSVPLASASASVVKPTANPKPQCPPGEVVSAGHCCPRGLVWQAGRCERPLATSF